MKDMERRMEKYLVINTAFTKLCGLVLFSSTLIRLFISFVSQTAPLNLHMSCASVSAHNNSGLNSFPAFTVCAVCDNQINLFLINPRVPCGVYSFVSVCSSVPFLLPLSFPLISRWWFLWGMRCMIINVNVQRAESTRNLTSSEGSSAKTFSGLL